LKTFQLRQLLKKTKNPNQGAFSYHKMSYLPNIFFSSRVQFTNKSQVINKQDAFLLISFSGPNALFTLWNLLKEKTGCLMASF
jgi:hypothetical protein